MILQLLFIILFFLPTSTIAVIDIFNVLTTARSAVTIAINPTLTNHATHTTASTLSNTRALIADLLHGTLDIQQLSQQEYTTLLQTSVEDWRQAIHDFFATHQAEPLPGQTQAFYHEAGQEHIINQCEKFHIQNFREAIKSLPNYQETIARLGHKLRHNPALCQKLNAISDQAYKKSKIGLFGKKKDFNTVSYILTEANAAEKALKTAQISQQKELVQQRLAKEYAQAFSAPNLQQLEQHVVALRPTPPVTTAKTEPITATTSTLEQKIIDQHQKALLQQNLWTRSIEASIQAFNNGCHTIETTTYALNADELALLTKNKIAAANFTHHTGNIIQRSFHSQACNVIKRTASLQHNYSSKLEIVEITNGTTHLMQHAIDAIKRGNLLYAADLIHTAHALLDMAHIHALLPDKMSTIAALQQQFRNDFASRHNLLVKGAKAFQNGPINLAKDIHFLVTHPREIGQLIFKIVDTTSLLDDSTLKFETLPLQEREAIIRANIQPIADSCHQLRTHMTNLTHEEMAELIGSTVSQQLAFNAFVKTVSVAAQLAKAGGTTLVKTAPLIRTATHEALTKAYESSISALDSVCTTAEASLARHLPTVQPVGAEKMSLSHFNETLLQKAETEVAQQGAKVVATAKEAGSIATQTTETATALKTSGQALAEKAEQIVGEGTKKVPGTSITKDITSRATKMVLKFKSKRSLQHHFEHAKQFGLIENWNKISAGRFEEILNAHVNSFKPIEGTYRGIIKVLHYFDHQTNLNVMVNMAGEVEGAWKLSADQVKYLLTTGAVK